MQQPPHQGHINKYEITDIATLFKCYYRFSPIYTTVMFQMVQQKSNLVQVAIGMHRVKHICICKQVLLKSKLEHTGTSSVTACQLHCLYCGPALCFYHLCLTVLHSHKGKLGVHLKKFLFNFLFCLCNCKSLKLR